MAIPRYLMDVDSNEEPLAALSPDGAWMKAADVLIEIARLECIIAAPNQQHEGEVDTSSLRKDYFGDWMRDQSRDK